MKKLFALLLALAMLICGAAFAEDEYIDMPHDTAIFFLDSVQYDFNLISVENPGNGFIDAIYSDDKGNYLGIAVSDTLNGGYFVASADAEDYASIIMLTADGRELVSSCSYFGYEDGYPCEMAPTAYDIDNWYQILAMGTMLNEATGETHSMTVAFDFIWDDGSETADTEVPVEEVYAVDEEAVAEETVVEEAADEEEYYIPDTLIVVAGDYYGEMDLLSIEYDGDVFVMYGDEEGNLFSIGIYDDLYIGEYAAGEVSGEKAYFMFTNDTVNYLGGCSDYVDDQYSYGFVEMAVEANGADGLFQIGFIGEMTEMTTGEVIETAGFADFTVEELK